MSEQDDKDDLLDALYALSTDGKRPSLFQAKLSYLPEWDWDRVLQAAKTLEEGGEITNINRRGPC